jgi:hypothetical protein
MANCNKQKNPLQRNGTAQSERLLPGLQKDYVQVDEKSFADWIVFAGEYTQLLHYYETTGNKNGDWSVFFTSDTTAVLGTIALQDVNAYKRIIKERLDFLKDDDNETLLPQAKARLNELFSITFSLAHAIDHYHHLLPADATFGKTLENQVKTSLAPALRRLLSYYKPLVIPPDPPVKDLLLPGNLNDLKVMGRQVMPVSSVMLQGLSKMWWIGQNSWQLYYDSVAADASIYGAEADAFLQIMHAANHNLFTGIFDVCLMGYSKLVTAAEKELLLALDKRNTHPAHYTLFLSFLKLFRTAQNDLNTLTGRHLDFYYKEILKLKPKAAAPNSAHIVVELAKPVNDHILAKDTLLKAGKDSAGKDVSYSLESETTFNKATVADLRAVYIGETGDDDTPGTKFAGRVFAAPVINSEDGAGAELTSTNKEWHPIANRLYSEGKVTAINMPEAEIGFAIASHYLYLQEGERKISLRLATSNNALLVNKNIAVYLTTEKEWFKVNNLSAIVTNNNLNKGTEPCAEISFTLSGDDPAITDYDTAIHGGTLNVKVPVVKIVLVHDSSLPYEYNLLKDLSLQKFEVAVSVGSMNSFSQQGIKQLLVSTDSGPVDTSKPFMPFGSFAAKDAGFVIGSKEIFTKKNANIRLNMEWSGLSEFSAGNIDFDSIGDYYPAVKFDVLEGGKWNTKNTEMYLMNSNTQQVPVFATTGQAIADTSIVKYDDDYNAYAANTKKGFLRFVLNGGFGHKAYQQALTAYLIDQSKDSPTLSEPKEPYTPVIQSLYISYTAYSDVVNVTSTDATVFAQKPASFYHLYPFGHAEQHAAITGSLSHYLLPQFSHKGSDGKDVPHQGEFYIGFKNLQRQQAVQVLFQVMDGTADPKISKPEAHIQWSFLAGHQWIDFKKQEISDNTRQLIQSGIIGFTIPAQATTEHSLLPTGLLWIKASVENKTDAICKLISVQAQAAVATFRNQDNAPDFLEQALAAGTISKLKAPQSSVKKITQPYPSFGGRPVEKSDAFYVRVSERLRHKARAITIWDYEHLVLEAFPMIHKVKCLNHTKSVDADYNEVLPGHVTIITIPNLQQRNDSNPLKPYTSQAMLDEIKDYLQKRISCHVNLHVVNPDFEEVKLTFKLRLADGYDDFTTYSNLLKQEITNFLSPWAFGGSSDISFGGSLHKSVLINFIEERTYVDYITDVQMSHFDANKVLIKPDNDTITATFAKSILVSVPASQHDITEIALTETAAQTECAGPNTTKSNGNYA